MTTTSSRRIAHATARFALALGSFGALGAAQQPLQSTPVNPSFRQIGQYELEIDGKPATETAFFHSLATGSILIRTPEVTGVLELQPRGRVVQTFAAEAFHSNTNGTLDKLPSAKALATTTFQLVDSLPQFEAGGHRLAVREKPPLLGPQTAQGILDHDPTYGMRAKLYQPQPDYVGMLSQVQEPVRVKVFFATWCSVCTELMPNVLRVEQELADSNIRFEYYGIPRNYDDPEVKRLQVTNLPTGIVYVGDQEVQRIVGYSWRFPDMSLRNLVLQHTRPAGP
jgi:thiol-disulfide isomerase/thioredoxin